MKINDRYIVERSLRGIHGINFDVVDTAIISRYTEKPRIAACTHTREQADAVASALNCVDELKISC